MGTRKWICQLFYSIDWLKKETSDKEKEKGEAFWAKNANVSYRTKANELGEARGVKRKINRSLAVVKGTASRMGFASGAQQLPNNLELKNYNNTDEVCEGF